MPRASATAERSVLTGKFLWLLFLWRKPSCRIGTRCQFRMSCRSKISKTAIMVATILSPRKLCPLTPRTWVYSHPKTRTSYVCPAYDRMVADERCPDLPLPDLIISLVHRAEHTNACVEVVAFSTAIAVEVCGSRRKDEVCGLTDSLPHHILISIATDARS